MWCVSFQSIICTAIDDDQSRMIHETKCGENTKQGNKIWPREKQHIQQKLFETSQRTQPDIAAFYDICMASRWIRHSLIRSHTQRAHITELRNTTTQYANYQYSHVKTCEKFPKSQSANQRSNDIGKKLTVPQYQWMQLLVHFMQY